MSKKAIFRFGGVLLVFLAVLGFFYYAPLFLFAHRIAPTDHVVVTISHQSESNSVSITLTGEEVRQVVKMVSAARRDFRTYRCIFDVRVTFYRGDDALGEIQSCPPLFLINGKQYRDETEVFDTLVGAPIWKAYADRLKR